MIRDAGFADLSLLAQLNADVQALHAEKLPWLFKHNAHEKDVAEVFRATLSDMAFFCKIAEHEGAAAGYVVAEFWQKEETELKHAHSMVYVHQIGVLPRFRRLGIGASLLTAVKDEGSASGIDLIALDVWSFNDDARSFFHKFGLATYTEKMWARIE